MLNADESRGLRVDVTVDFEKLLKDVVYIEKADGTRIGPFKTGVSEGSATIFDGKLDVNDGERLIRPLPNGREEVHLITSADYSPGMGNHIPAHYNLKLQKTTAIRPEPAKHTNVTINHSTGVQVGDHNVRNIQNAINELVQRIDSSSGSPQDKAEAKSRLSAVLAHPLVGSIVGGIAGSLVSGAAS